MRNGWSDNVIQNIYGDEIGDLATRRLAQRLNAQYAIANTLSQHENHRDTLTKVLQVIGETLEWEGGALWLIDENTKKLICGQVWQANPGKNKSFLHATQNISFGFGEGLPGRVWATRRPQWVVDVTKAPFFLRAKEAVENGLHGAFAFPLLSGRKVLGVIDFASHEVRPPDKDLLNMVGAAGQQIGQYLAHVKTVEEQDSLLKQLKQERHRVEQAAIESEQRASELDAVFAALGDSLVVYDAKGAAVSANPAAIKMLGFNPVGLENHGLADKASIRHRRGEKIAFAELPSALALQGQKMVSKYIVIKNFAGRDVMMTCSAAPIRRREKIVGAVMLLHDVSESWSVEKQKDDFVAIASHELRTPISTVKAFTQILERHLSRSADEASKKYIGKIGTQLDRLAALVDELLEVSRIGTGKLELNKEMFDLEDLVRETVEDFQRTVDTHTVIVKGGLQREIFADRDRIGQVLLNLLSNAVKYSPEAEKVVVSVKEGVGNVTVEVKDFGIGISRKNQAKIFDRFFRVSGKTNGRFPGLGLGLHISSEIIKRHEGELRVKSTPGKGTTFSFSLPFKYDAK